MPLAISVLIGILLHTLSGNVLGYIPSPSDFHFAPGPNPLDPLSAEEIRETVSIIRFNLKLLHQTGTQVLGNWVFNWVTLQEPEKYLLLPYFLNDKAAPTNSPIIPRKSFTVLVEKQSNTVVEVIVNLSKKTVESWTGLPDGTQAMYTTEDNVDPITIALEDPRVQERCREMGWTNMSLIAPETWSVPYTADRPELASVKRPVFLLFYGRLFDGDLEYAHPFDFAVFVDIASKKVVAIDNLPSHNNYDANNRKGNVCPKTPRHYDPAFQAANFYRTDLHPIKFSQPGGASFQVNGNEVTWQKFKFRVGWNGREGLVIHQVSYKDGLNRRPLFYRLSVAELFVPYGDARPPYQNKYPFDEGEFTLGFSPDHDATRLCASGGQAAYFTFDGHDEKGDTYPLPNAVCIVEEDTGLLWAHWGPRFIQTRSQRLTVTFFPNLGNYDYRFSWHFYLDATVEFSTQLFGIVSTQLAAEGETGTAGFGTIVAPGINAQYHQHNVGLRIDAEIDGPLNVVSTVDVVELEDPTGSPKNPYGQGFTAKETPLRTPSEARTQISPATARSWMIRNPQKIHPYTKKPVGWKLVPYNSPRPFVKKDSPLHARMAWADYNTWVTKYRDGQLYPGGAYLNASGLPEWVEENPDEDLTNTDIVLWYIYSFVHLPRVEDFPIMPVESTSVFLKPTNFFLENPALDVPPFVATLEE